MLTLKFLELQLISKTILQLKNVIVHISKRCIVIAYTFFCKNNFMKTCGSFLIKILRTKQIKNNSSLSRRAKSQILI